MYAQKLEIQPGFFLIVRVYFTSHSCMEEKEKHATVLDIKSNCILCPCISLKYLQSIHAVNLNKINNTFDRLILVIAHKML